MELDTSGLNSADIQNIDTQASTLMEDGIRLMDAPQPEAAAAALECFDRALDLRRALPVERSPMLRYGLAACWLNRAEILMRLGSPEQIKLALCAYDEAIALLRDLPLHEDALFPRRLAIAHQNRGIALRSQNPPAIAAAHEEFSKAIQILEHKTAFRINDRLYLLAAVWMNLADTRLAGAGSGSEQLAAEAARRAISLITGLEFNDVYAAEIGMKARHVLCRAIALRLSQITNSHHTVPQEVHEATDAADGGLALERRWEEKGVDRFRKIAHDLFLFGIRVYGKYQPQFLHEFVSENMNPANS